MTDNRKLKRAAVALMGIVCVLLLLFAFEAIRGVVHTPAWDVFMVANYIVGILLVVGILGLALVLLSSVRKKETPFNHKNVKYLKVIAILLVVYELASWIMSMLVSRLYPPMILEDGTSVTVHLSFSGVVLAAGLVVYCIALAFQYGISLQVQIDETL
jgi:amino acid transporter